MSFKNKAIAALEAYRGNSKGLYASTVAGCIKVIRELPEDDGWIPVTERLPDADKYILLAFENASFVDIGRYEEDEQGGAFYQGDYEKNYVTYGLFVKAWMPLPEPPKGER